MHKEVLIIFAGVFGRIQPSENAAAMVNWEVGIQQFFK
jgi:hypothetical protein